MKCSLCNCSGDHMKKCTKCGIVFCDNPECILKKFGVKVAGNECPNCRTCGTKVSAN